MNSNKMILHRVTLSMLVPLLVIVWQLFASSCVLHNQHVIVEGFSSVATTTTGKTIRRYQQLHPHINNKIRSNIDLLTTSCRSSSSFPSSSSASSSKMHMLPPGTAIDIIDGTTQLMSSAAGIIDPMMAAQHIMMKTSTLHLSVAPVEIFDGSSIIDPVVISTSFWSALQRQILSVILGQIFAAVVFSILASFLAPQLSSFRDFILSKLSTNDSSSTSPSSTTTPTKPFIKADSIIVRPEPDFGKLLICLLIDIIGVSSEAVPILGEFTDIISAPISAAVLQNLFPGSSKFVFLFELTEEILPFTDIIPFATICWIIDTYYPESSVADVFQLGKNYANALETATKTTATATATATQQNKFNSFVDTTAETIDSSRESKEYYDNTTDR